MSYTLILPPDTKTEIREYILERHEGPEAQRALAAEIIQELEKLAINPALGTVIYGGPFETRPIYRFAVDQGSRYVQVTYKVHKQDRLVVVSGFAPVAF